MKQAISGRPLVLHESVQDTFVWGSRLEGTYYVKEGYRWLCDQLHSDPQATTSWSWIWRLAAPEKLKIFIWCISHNAIPTLDLLHHRGMAPNNISSRCKEVEETIFHCLCDYSASSSIWHALGFNSVDFFL